MSTLLPYPELAPRGPDAMLRELETYQPSWGEYLSAAAGEGWWASVPGQAEARLKAPDVLPDETQLEVRSRMSGVPVEQIRANMARAEQPVEPSPLLSREEFEGGDWKREGLDWDPRMTESRARAMAQVFDENEYRRWVLSRDVSAGKQLAGFLTQIAVGFSDPVNYIPVFGPAARAAAAARFGRVAGTAAVHSAEAALTTAAVQPLLLPSRQAFGDDVGFADAVMDVGFSALFGAAVGAGAGTGAWARWRGDPLVHDVGVQRTAAEALAAAADDVARGAAPDLKDLYRHVPEEVAKLRSAMQQVTAAPDGDPLDPSVFLKTPEIEEGALQEILVARGGFKKINSLEISPQGWGLIKVAWKHGWKSQESPEIRVTESDVLALPRILKEYAPLPAELESNSRYRTWVVETGTGADSRKVIYGMTRQDDNPHRTLTTIYVPRPGSRQAGMPLSQKRSVGDHPASFDELSRPVKDTAVSSAEPVSQGQVGTPTRNTIPPSGVEFTPNVMGRADLSPERAEALPDVDTAVPLLSPDAQKLRDAIRQIEANPVGNPLSPMVPLTTHDMQQVIVARGGFRNINSMEISKRGWGLVKVIWKHGWQSHEPDHLKVTEDDVLAFPEIIQTMLTIESDASARRAPDSLTWVIERDSPYGKRRILYGANTTRHHENQILVTVYVVSPDDQKYSLPLSEKVVGETPASHSEAGNPPVDTAVASSQSRSRGQVGSPTEDTIPPSGVEFTPNVRGRADLSPERAEALPDVDAVAADVLRPATSADLAADLAAEMGLDLDTGLFDGVERFRQLEAEGRITAEEAAEIRAAEEMMGKADRYAKAFEAAAIFMGSRV